MTIENGTSNRGAVLLAELKALVDSFPPHQRTDVIKTIEIVFRGLNADYQGRHSVHLQLEAGGVLDSPSPETQSSPDLSDECPNENHGKAERER